MTNTTVDQIETRPLSLSQPLEWLQKGWQDFMRAPIVGLAHGICVDLFGLALLVIAHDQFWILAGAFTGFLAVAPVVAVGLYAVSRALEKGEPAGFKVVFRTWWSWRGHPHHDWRLVKFGLLLCLSGTGWVLTSAALITLFAPEPVNQPLDFIRHVVLAPDSYLFEGWLVLGGALAAPVFASTVVTLPLLMDRNIGILDAVLVSWKVVIENPAVMGLWAALIMVTAMLGALALIGSIVVIPVLGHASWHVYRDAVRAERIPPRLQE
ncbi:MAG: DUF2189 domain-containing protein [Ketobacteraceae bacterium]|nr:DUF2189 domain-containing protein [Ketobacteraceae bacterium]